MVDTTNSPEMAGGRGRLQRLKINLKEKKKRKPWRAGLEVLGEAGPSRSHPEPLLTFPPSQRLLDPMGLDGLQKESLPTKLSQ